MDETPAVWAADPERADPDDYSPGAPFVKEVTWAPCETCGIEVHLPVTRFVYQGLACPRCGERLLAPPADPQEWLRRVLREEDELSEQL